MADPALPRNVPYVMPIPIRVQPAWSRLARCSGLFSHSLMIVDGCA
jgi:hypothetical protein